MEDRLHIRTAQNVDLAVIPADLGKRIGAWFLDLIIVIAYAFVAFFVLGELAVQGAWPFIVFVALPIMLYPVLGEVLFNGRTPGKMAFRIQVVRLDGAAPTLGQYLLRWLLRFVDITFTSGLVALTSIAVTRRSQRLGDLAAGTAVVDRRRRVRLEEVRYPHVSANYEPRFPEAAARLSDADVRLLRAARVKIRLLGRKRGRRLARRAKEATERKLGLEPVSLPPEVFLETLIQDHVALADRVSMFSTMFSTQKNSASGERPPVKSSSKDDNSKDGASREAVPAV